VPEGGVGGGGKGFFDPTRVGTSKGREWVGPLLGEVESWRREQGGGGGGGGGGGREHRAWCSPGFLEGAGGKGAGSGMEGNGA